MSFITRSINAARAPWRQLALIAAINTGIALTMWIDDPRPFWHPLATAQSFGFAIAWSFNLLAPWKSDKPLRWTVVSAMLGAVVGMLLVILIKQYSLADILGKPVTFFWTVLSGFVQGLFISVFFLTSFRDAQSRIDLQHAEAERQRFARAAADARLEALQAQVQPHFLFNSLGTVQALIAIDPPTAEKLLGHLTDYLRSSLVELQARTVTLGSECQRVHAYLEIMQIRLGSKLRFSIDCPVDLESISVPPHVLTSLAENAIKHGIEVSGAGRIEISILAQKQHLKITVCDYLDRPLPESTVMPPRTSHGLGHKNVRDTLAAIYGDAARFEFVRDASSACATITLPR